MQTHLPLNYSQRLRRAQNVLETVFRSETLRGLHLSAHEQNAFLDFLASVLLGIEPPYVAEQIAEHVITWPVRKLAQSVCELQPCPDNQINHELPTVATTVT
jgi:hypothetical protein